MKLYRIALAFSIILLSNLVLAEYNSVTVTFQATRDRTITGPVTWFIKERGSDNFAPFKCDEATPLTLPPNGEGKSTCQSDNFPSVDSGPHTVRAVFMGEQIEKSYGKAASCEKIGGKCKPLGCGSNYKREDVSCGIYGTCCSSTKLAIKSSDCSKITDSSQCTGSCEWVIEGGIPILGWWANEKCTAKEGNPVLRIVSNPDKEVIRPDEDITLSAEVSGLVKLNEGGEYAISYYWTCSSSAFCSGAGPGSASWIYEGTVKSVDGIGDCKVPGDFYCMVTASINCIGTIDACKNVNSFTLSAEKTIKKQYSEGACGWVENPGYHPEDMVCRGKEDRILMNGARTICDTEILCGKDLDYVVDDAIDCCDGTPIEGAGTC